MHPARFRHWVDLIPEMQVEVARWVSLSSLAQMALSLCSKEMYRKFALHITNPYEFFWMHCRERAGADAVLVYCDRHWEQYCLSHEERLNRLSIVQLVVFYWKRHEKYAAEFRSLIVRLEAWMVDRGGQWSLLEPTFTGAILNNAPFAVLDLFLPRDDDTRCYPSVDLTGIALILSRRDVRCFHWLERNRKEVKNLPFDDHVQELPTDTADDWWRPDHPFIDRFFTMFGRKIIAMREPLSNFLIARFLKV